MEKVDGYSITVPMPKFESGSVDLFSVRLSKLLNAKANIIKKALNTDTIDYEIKDGNITFNWLKGDATPEMIQSTTKMICGIVKLIATGQSVKAKEREIKSEKYAMRCFLLRLGFIGDEFKLDRKVLMQNLTGSSSFRTEIAP